MKKQKKRRFGKLIVLLLVFCLGASCAGHGSKSSTEQPPANPVDQTEVVTPEEMTTEETAEETTEKPSDKAPAISPDFKAAMDSYEAFFDEYINFMKKYAESDKTDMNALLEYTEYLSKYADAMEKMDAIEDSDLNDAELAYYLKVTARIEKKLLEVATIM